MLRLQTLEENGFTWLFLESRLDSPEFADLVALELPQVRGDRGLVICSGGLPPWAVLGVGSHYRNLTRWQGYYVPKARGARNERDYGVLVLNTTDLEYPRLKVMDVRLPCLTCHDQGVKKRLRADAIYPYCARHQNRNPARQSYIPRRGGSGVADCSQKRRKR